ncbi:MAG: carbamoyltransferase N-terminal domain-containing protein [Candidatus Woesearchaeota archaeon]|jgi:carbamoyltransferase|nr:carbamoyltransferase N-terminal domain-containing protein [Candidatus Woesearchaeota archaeon]|tara:strand:+ start:747 stop:2507 length:1761 start_codon:yes stop_codon:yes gene_type:complete
MYILGISCYYHDSSAALLKDGVIVAAAQEERFTRKKHDTSFPFNAANYCLKSQNITIKNVSYVGFYEKPFLKFERVLSQHLEMFPKSFKTFLASIPSWINEKLRVTKTIKKKLEYKGDVLFIEHHLAHAAAAFLISPFEKAAICTIDGVGEWTTTAYGIGNGKDIHLMKEINFPSSLGLLYSTITAYLGFSVNNSEYKVMGLSPYGNKDKNTNPYYRKLMQVIDIKEDGSYSLDMSYFIYHYADRMPSKKLCKLLDGPVRKPESELTQRHKDIAAALQWVYERVLFKMLNHVCKETKSENVVLAGGCGLNSVANGKILRNTLFKNIWLQSDPGDGGTSIGTAAYIYHSVLGNKRNYIFKDAYLGPGFSTEEIKSFLDKNKIRYSEFKDEKEIIEVAAKLIYNNNVVGWFQLGMEWGPRALGARSILSNACNSKMQEILNHKVKHREKFRPFAPVVCEDDALKYFECDVPISETTDFMLMVYPIRKEWHDKIPAVTHVDGSGRLQTIRRHQNQLYYDLIKKFGKLSGIPILINTSFNIRGEPIVCTPYDAYKCMMGTGIDCIVMGNFLIKREDNPQDIWDSEKYAKD